MDIPGIFLPLPTFEWAAVLCCGFCYIERTNSSHSPVCPHASPARQLPFNVEETGFPPKKSPSTIPAGKRE